MDFVGPSVALFLISAASATGLGVSTNEAKMTQAFYVIIVTLFGTCITAITTVYNVAFSVVAKTNEEQAKREGTGSASAGTGNSFGSLQTGWAVGMCVGPVAAEILLENFRWLGLCIFQAQLSLLSAFIISETWLEWEQLEDDQCEGL